MPQPPSIRQIVQPFSLTTIAAALGTLFMASGGDAALLELLVWICLAGLVAVLALIWTVLAVLLLRASLRVNGPGFERVVYLIKLVLHVPLYLRQRPTREAEEVVRAVILEPPPLPMCRMCYCTRCLLRGIDRRYQRGKITEDVGGLR